MKKLILFLAAFLSLPVYGGIKVDSGGSTVGSAVSGGTNDRVLYKDSSGNLATDNDLQFDGTTLTINQLTMTDGTRIVNGSYSASPSMTFLSASNGSLGLGVDGGTYFFIEVGTQDIGIGTTSPAYKLDVNGVVRSTGIIVTGGMTEKHWLPAAGCNNATASTIWDLPTSNAPAPGCRTGSNMQKGVLDFDSGTDESGFNHILLPTDWTGAVDANFVWSSTTTETNSAVWAIQVGCAADNESDDPAFNSASTVTDAYGGTSGSKAMVASVTGITTTGCAAGEFMNIKVYRDADNGSDNLTGDARLIGVELTIRRTQ